MVPIEKDQLSGSFAAVLLSMRLPRLRGPP
jgi:hypothetical protein